MPAIGFDQRIAIIAEAESWPQKGQTFEHDPFLIIFHEPGSN